MFFFGGNYFADILPRSSKWLVWRKNKDPSTNSFSDSELIWTNIDGTQTQSFYVQQMGMINDGDARYHPTQKPVRLMKMILDKYVPAGSTVFDPFAGSGTTGVACLELGYHVTMCEKESDYCEIIRSRCSEFQPDLFASQSE